MTKMTDTVNVPREPTREMTMAGSGCLPSVDGVFGLAGALSANVYRAMLAAAPKAEPIHIIFDGPPSPDGARFVEVENPEGRSINAGEWSQRSDGLWQLVIPVTHPAPASDELLEALKQVTMWLEALGPFKGGCAVALEDAQTLIAKHKGPQS